MASKKRLIDANDVYKLFDKNGMARIHVGDIDTIPRVDAVEVPPVKIGDKAYFIINKKIYEAKICLITWSQYRYTTTTEIRGEVQKGHTVSVNFSEWGKTVFATKVEAERKLYPCEYCFCGTYRSCEGCSYGERRTI